VCRDRFPAEARRACELLEHEVTEIERMRYAPGSLRFFVLTVAMM